MRRAGVAVVVLAVGLAMGMPAAADPPANSGPIVIRTDDEAAWFLPEEEAGMSVALGWDPLEFCGGTVEFDVLSLQEISVPEDANRLIDLLKGEVRTSVWPFIVFDCGLFTTVEPLATGYSDLVSTDNDLRVFLNPDNINANAFGLVAHGALYDADGDRKQFSFMDRLVWDGVDSDSLKFTTKIKLAG